MKIERFEDTEQTDRRMKRFFRTTLSDVTYAARRLTDGHAIPRRAPAFAGGSPRDSAPGAHRKVPRAWPGGSTGLRILTYHRVTDAHPGDRLCVPVARFEEQMRWLHEQGYRTVTLTEAVRWATSGRNAGMLEAGSKKLENQERRRGDHPKHSTAVSSSFQFPASSFPSVALTFDDGFQDNVLHAAPVLQRYGLSGCFFIPTGFIEHGPLPGRHEDDQPMSWPQLEALRQAGHEIGGHSVSHRRLASLGSIEMFWEARGCKETLEHHLGGAVEFFCYPSGDYNALVRQAVIQSGYQGACTVEPGANRPGTDPFALKRTEISAFDTLWDLEKKLAGAYDWLHSGVQTVKKKLEARGWKLESRARCQV